MIKEIKGDLLTAPSGILCHQVNTLGIAGSGIVIGFRDTFVNWFIQYKDLCDQYKSNPNQLLGTTQYLKVNDHLLVANMFSQFSVKPLGRNTDLDALKNCLTIIHNEAFRNDFNVYVPKYLASVRGGMDWEAEVYPIIEEIFNDSSVNLYLVDYVKGLKIEH